MSSVTLKKAARLWRDGGVKQLLRRGAVQARGYTQARLAMRHKPVFRSVDDLLNYSFDANSNCLKPLQVRSEIQGLLEILQQRRPRRIMEIGTANGGTLFLFSRVAASDAHLISLDLPGGEFGEGYPTWKMPLYRAFALPGQHIDLIRGNSHDPQMPSRMRQLLASEPLDFLFIDGDHTYDGVKMDFDMYSPLVRKGGVVAFHDIAQHLTDDCQVTRYWNDLKSGYEHRELLEDGGRGWGGIGVLFL